MNDVYVIVFKVDGMRDFHENHFIGEENAHNAFSEIIEWPGLEWANMFECEVSTKGQILMRPDKLVRSFGL